MSFSKPIGGAIALDAVETAKASADNGMSDEDLLDFMRAGDELAFRLLVTRHVYRAQRLAVRLVGNVTAAEDIVQDVFLQIWIKRADWRRTQAKFTSWLFRVVYNRCMDMRRKRRDVALDGIDEPTDDQADAVTRIYRNHVMRKLREAMAQLPGSQYVALFLSYHEGYSTKDTAAAMGISLQAVESLLKRGRQNLRDQLKRDRLNVQHAFPDP
ncbi:sigma-70 family RNA polymerase sigma factor [Dongia rigui]|uniref:sigma-70 family RNA polymerase sigma factor n=1 Tax=Dongia rigui TaxID=940149 RepID=UPI002A6A386F|nr:sigma-70 family RNA polymerase sigma factor [Dongia rigui]